MNPRDLLNRCGTPLFSRLWLAALLLACAPGAIAAAPAQKPATMNATTAPVTKPRLTADVALRRVLVLIRTIRSVTDITPEYLQMVMRVPVQHWGVDDYGFGVDVTPQWTFGVEAKKVYNELQVELSFNSDPDASPPPTTDICQFDFEQFAAALTAMGYSRESEYDYPPIQPHFDGIPDDPPMRGRWMYDIFSRKEQPSLVIEVFPRGISDRNPNSSCIKMITISDDSLNPYRPINHGASHGHS